MNANWINLSAPKKDNLFFRQQVIFNFNIARYSELNFDKCIFAVSSNKGAVAVTLDPKNLLHIVDVATEKTLLYILSGSGETIMGCFSIPTTIIAFGWLTPPCEELLICIFADGQIWIYNTCSFLTTLNLFSESENREHISVATVQNNHLVAATSSSTIICVKFEGCSPYKSKPYRIASWCPSDIITAVSVSRSGVVYAAFGESVAAVGRNSTNSTFKAQENIRYIAAAPQQDGTGTVAVLTWRNNLIFLDHTLQNVLFSCVVEGLKPQNTDSLCWSAQDAAIVCTTKFFFIASPLGASVRFDEVCRARFCQSTLDAALLLEPGCLKIVQRVPQVLLKVSFMSGVASPGCYLSTAYTQSQIRDGQIDLENSIICSTPQMLESGIKECLEAALELTATEDEAQQQQMLKIAHFGRSYAIGGYASAHFERSLAKVYVIRALKAKCGISVTNRQLDNAASSVVHSLIGRKQFSAAHFALKTLYPCDPARAALQGRVYISWVLNRLKSGDGVSVSDLIREARLRRLEPQDAAHVSRNVAISDVARWAFQLGRNELALELVNDYIGNTVERLGLLLLFGEEFPLETYLKALSTESKTVDAELVILYLHTHLSPTCFYAFMHEAAADDSSDRASAFLEYVLGHVDSRKLQDFYFQEDAREQALFASLSDCSFSDATALDSIANIRAHDRTLKPYLARLREQISLVREQEKLDAEYGALLELQSEKPFLGNSLAMTVARLFKMNQQARALKLAKDFKMNPRQLYWLQIRALIHSKNTEAIMLLAARPCPLAIPAVVEELLAAQLVDTAQMYAAKASLEMQPLLYKQIEDFQLKT